MAAIGIVLVIACANVANLMLVRSDSRRQEFAVRLALGAGRGQIARQVMVDSLLIAFAGGLLGLALARAGMRLVLATAPGTLPRVGDLALDPVVIAFAIGAALVSAVLFGAVPTLKQASRRAQPLTGARAGGTTRERQRARHVLVVVQVGLALV